jgi:hypothetical protein
MEKILLFLMFATVIFSFVICGLAIKSSREAKEQLRRYTEIQLGMSEDIMLHIMGDGYNRSLLKNGRIKYEWRINATSTGYSYKGVSSRSYSGVQKVTIYVKNGAVEEVKPYNV